MNTSAYQQVRDAILQKKQVIARYQQKYREMCPHSIGWKRGREQALFLQFAGESSSGLGNPEDNWRCIPIAQLEIIEIRAGQWYTASNHSRKSTCIDTIDVEVSF